MPEKWKPEALDRYKAHEAYFRYAAGIVMLNDPESVVGLHRRSVENPAQNKQIIVHAQTLMWAGLSDIIRYSNPPELRSPFAKTENNYREALPHMRATVEEVAEEETDRLERLNPSLPILRPLPVAHEAIYKAIAHGRKVKVHLSQAMDAFAVSSSFGEDIEQSTFEEVPRITIAHRESAQQYPQLVANDG